MRSKFSFVGLVAGTFLALSTTGAICAEQSGPPDSTGVPGPGPGPGQPPALASGSDSDFGPETILIVAERDARTSKGATGLELSLADTPQSETIIDSTTLDTFALTDINSMLDLVTGVNVERAETDRTYYNARGFDITSMQVDGVGMPFDSLIVGDIDTALYDKVEIVRGANGLLTGTGNPSGTINYVRKRPTNEFQASAKLGYGTWDMRRAEVDVSTPLTDSGSWAARVVGVVQGKDSWLNLYSNRRKLIYGVVDGQIGAGVTVTAGISHQDNSSDGVTWGAVSLLDSHGEQVDYDVSTTTAQPWTYWNTRATTTFVEVNVVLGGDWKLKSVANYGTYFEPANLLYVYGNTDPDDGNLGLYGWPGGYTTRSHSALSDTSLSGRFELFGQAHQATLGVSLAKSGYRSFESTLPAEENGFAVPAFPGWDGSEVPVPHYLPRYLAAQYDTRINRLYGAARVSLADSLKFIAGFNGIDSKTSGDSYGVNAYKKERGVSPYLGLTWRFVPNANVYASYSDIFQPQSQIDVNHRPLGSAKGSSYEAGVKSEWFDKRLLATLALFRADQSNFAEFAGYIDNDFSFAPYRGISFRSQGYEVEFAGKPVESLTLQTGWTQLSLKAPDGSDARTFIPRRTLKLLATWEVPGVEGFGLGASARWQSGIYTDSTYYNTLTDETTAGRIRQNAYAIVGVNATYKAGEHLEFGLNVDNLGDEKYFSSLIYEQSFYGAPRSVIASVKVKY